MNQNICIIYIQHNTHTHINLPCHSPAKPFQWCPRIPRTSHVKIQLLTLRLLAVPPPASSAPLSLTFSATQTLAVFTHSKLVLACCSSDCRIFHQMSAWLMPHAALSSTVTFTEVPPGSHREGKSHQLCPPDTLTFNHTALCYGLHDTSQFMLQHHLI